MAEQAPLQRQVASSTLVRISMSIISASELDAMQDELKELRAEVSRHHKDFEKIRQALDSIESIEGCGTIKMWAKDQALKDIRNIVG